MEAEAGNKEIHPQLDLDQEVTDFLKHLETVKPEPTEAAPEGHPAATHFSHCSNCRCCCSFDDNIENPSVLPTMMKDVACLTAITFFTYLFRPQDYFWGFVESAFGLASGEAVIVQSYLISALAFVAALYIIASVYGPQSPHRPLWITNVLKISIVVLFLLSFYYLSRTGLMDKLIWDVFDCKITSENEKDPAIALGKCPAITFP